MNMFLLTEQGLLTKQYEGLTDISADRGFKDKYTNIPLINFWDNLKEDCKLFLCPSTHLWKTALSRYAATETKYQNTLNLEQDMRIQLSKIVSDFNNLMASKQVQSLH
jgi:hypothetical protein